jgi:hypothetical protein
LHILLFCRDRCANGRMPASDSLLDVALAAPYYPRRRYHAQSGRRGHVIDQATVARRRTESKNRVRGRGRFGNDKERGGSRPIAAEDIFLSRGIIRVLSCRSEEVGIARPKRVSNLAIVPQSYSYSNSSSYSIPSLIFPNRASAWVPISCSLAYRAQTSPAVFSSHCRNFSSNNTREGPIHGPDRTLRIGMVSAVYHVMAKLETVSITTEYLRDQRGE